MTARLVEVSISALTPFLCLLMSEGSGPWVRIYYCSQGAIICETVQRTILYYRPFCPPKPGCLFCWIIGRTVGYCCCFLIFSPEGSVCTFPLLIISKVNSYPRPCSGCFHCPLNARATCSQESPSQSNSWNLVWHFHRDLVTLAGGRALGPFLPYRQQPAFSVLCPPSPWNICSYWFGARITSLSRAIWNLIPSSVLVLCFWKYHKHGSISVT